MQDADEAVREPAERVAVVAAAGALLVVVGRAPGDAVSDEKAQDMQGVDEPVVVDEPGGDDFVLPEARVIGLVPP